MSELLIFGGTTEGRLLAEFCSENKIRTYISVATDYGAELLCENKYISVLNNRLDCADITALIMKKKFAVVIDATHPYAVIATENIRSACIQTGANYYRLKRKNTSKLSGTIINSTDEIIKYLNNDNKRILSTLGSKELPLLTNVNNSFDRIWIRVLPVDGILQYCSSLGFDQNKVILGKGPFTIEQNIAHIKKSSAEILITKESGVTGGYPEKAEAAQQLGIELVTIKRPEETGNSFDEIKHIILKETK